MRLVRAVRVAGPSMLLAISSAVAGAQMPGLPTLQNAFTNRGLAFAANFGGGSGQSIYGAAAAWGLGGVNGDGRLSVSAGAAAQRANEATRGVYGARVAARLWSSAGGSLGFGGFAGIGGAPRTRSATTTINNPAVMVVPVGMSAGYRRGIGARRGISIYASPFYRWSRAEADTVVSSGTIRFSAGLDFAFTRALGLTVGGEFGGKTKGERESGTLGAAVSFIPGGRR